MNLSVVPTNKARTWGVHVVTASGMTLALLALLALVDNEPQACLFWLGLTLLVDGLDSTLACKYKVKEMLPHPDGLVLDLVIDYPACVFALTTLVYCYVPLPERFEPLTVGAILVSSLFCFYNVNMKSADNYFVGFPVAWNAMAVYSCVLDLYPQVNLVTVLVLAALTLTRMKSFHPFRVRQFIPPNIVVTFIWLISSGLLIVQQPVDLPILPGLWFAALAYFVSICFWCSAREWFG